MSARLLDGRYAYLGDGVVVAAAARLPLAAHPLWFGSAGFESLRTYATPAGPRLLGLAPHLDRLRHSLGRLGLAPVGDARASAALRQTAAANRLADGYLRLIAFPDGDAIGLAADSMPTALAVLAWRVEGGRVAPPPLRLAVSRLRRAPGTAVLSGAKVTGSYAIDMVAHHHARAAGFDDALLLHDDGSVCEMAGAHLFMVERGRLLTPHTPHGIDGVTRRLLIALAAHRGLEVGVETLSLERFKAADEVFASGTFHGIRPVTAIDGAALPAAPGPVTRLLREELTALLDDPDHPLAGEWLTAVTDTPARAGGEVADEAASEVASEAGLDLIDGVVLRPAGRDDRRRVLAGVDALLAELRGAAPPQLPEGAAEVCGRLLAGHQAGVVLLAEADDTPGGDTPDGAPLLGFIAATVQEALRCGGAYALIQELWVDGAARDRAVGRALLAALDRWCARRGIGVVEVGLPGPTFAQYERTLGFYRSCGYTVLGPRLRKTLTGG